MRKINKGQPLSQFTAFKKNNPSANWDTLHEDAHKHIYNATREEILLNEQNCLCGYTEIPIKEFTEVHLDHYRKKGIFPKLTFDWDNLIAATKDDDFGAHYKDGEFKIKAADYKNIFNPVIDFVENYFDYDMQGKIIPQKDLNAELKAKVIQTVKVFNLNNYSLVTKRVNIIKQIIHYKGLPKEDIINAFKARGFVSLVHQYAEDMA